ncbi:WD repeat protein [Talaromyces stipitatus ATCC 10500]|uniref:WD repeat protein n=1 Tax=Talaromyces stipitatus (strain ATCC 10500 / CBS 375.48 / QM 6759 / NRRL 1006) TaxID=441959 RepID=B8M2Y5_TALSN|nr:WD repeat protein [Talaromyces stipitatus ATCC 10500]EED22240.1 WD repeat protein [Talaromyces stipitatus ATCC 10500]
MHTLQATASSSLSLPSGTYIYAIAASTPSTQQQRQFALISSDDSLRLFDGQSLHPLNIVSAKCHDGVTALKEYRGNGTGGFLLGTAGRDGAVRLWDPRSTSQKAGIEMNVEKKCPILSLSCDPESYTIVAGTELESYQATVALWDIRAPGQIRQQYIESHNDDVTELQFHPTRKNVLLSGSTDGLVNLYDTNIQDEDETLLQVINHGSIHHAGFLSDDAVYALSHDETFSIHPITNPDSEEPHEPSPIQFGDVRPSLHCEYVVQALSTNQGTYLAAGNTTEKCLDLFPITPSPTWGFDYTNVWRLPEAHGEEIVRAVYLDEQSRTVFTGGEDGFIRAWRQNGSDHTEDDRNDGQEQLSSDRAAARARDKKKYKDEKRFRPY